MDQNNILSLLGLALRGGNLAVGEEPVEAVARARDARVLLLASDAAENTRRRVEHFAEAGQCLWLRLPFTKAELGKAVGRTSVAITAVTDIGLADALAKKLAALDPAQYGEAARRLELKAKRAAQRRLEQQTHEKNLRTGKRRPKKTPTPALRKPEPPGGECESAPPDRRNPAAKPERPFRRRSAQSAPGRPHPYAHSRPVKKGKGSFRKREDGGRS